jgi:outer membrane receptor protein involved in Fe transport
MNIKVSESRSGSEGDSSTGRISVKSGLVLLAATACVGIASPGWAQQASASSTASKPQQSDSQSIDEIVVTAQKRSERIQDVPLSITAYSGAQLVEQGITDVTEIAQETPGVSERNSGPGQTEYEMRGIASSGGSSPTVGFYLDETPLTPPADSQTGKVVIDPSLYDLNRVEVLRGPQGTLYGSGSMGGTIKLVTNQPDPSAFAASAEVIGSDTPAGGVNYGVNAMVNIPLSDIAALRIVGTDKYTAGWIDRVVISPFPQETNGGNTRGNVLAAPVQSEFKDVNNERLTGGRATLLVQPTDRLSISAGIFSQKITQGGQNYADSPPGVDYETHYQPYDIAEPYTDSFSLASLTIKYNFDAFQLTAAGSQYQRDTHMVQDSTEQTQNFFLNVFQIPGVQYSDVGPLATYGDDWSQQRSAEVRLTSNGTGGFQWLVGAFSEQFTSNDNVYTNTPTGPLATEVFGVNSYYNITVAGSAHQSAGFGEASYEFDNKLKLTTGLRYYSYTNNSIVGGSGGLPNGSLTPTYTATPSSSSGVNPKFNLSYRPGEDLTLYAQASKGFRPGGGNQAPPQHEGCPPNPLAYKSDGLWSYELGENAQLFQNRLTLNTAVYYENWTGIQQEVADACGFTYTGNAGTAGIYGTEIELKGVVTPEVTVSTSGGYTHAKITQAVAGGTFYVGEQIQEVPTWTNTTAFEYHQPVTENFNFMARLANVYVGPTTDVSAVVNNLPGRDFLNLRSGLVDRHGMSVLLFVNNLTDKRAILDNVNAFSFNVPALNRVATNQPRTIGVDLTYQFGGPARD